MIFFFSLLILQVFVQTNPYPNCHTYDLCKHNTNYRINYAVSALSQHIEIELLKLGTHNIRIVDAMNIVRANKDHQECINHFLCRHGGLQKFRVGATRAGMALAEEIFRAMCDV